MSVSPSLQMCVLPVNELLLEAIGKIWLRLPGAAGGAVTAAAGVGLGATSGTALGTVVVGSGGTRSTYWLGTLLLTTHRLVFIPYPPSTRPRQQAGYVHLGSDSVRGGIHGIIKNSSGGGGSNSGSKHTRLSQNTTLISAVWPQEIGSSFPLCLSLCEVHSVTVKKRWKERFTALEV